VILGETGAQPLIDLLEILRPDAPLDDLATLPKGYMDRYRARAKEIEERLQQHARQFQRELRETGMPS